MRSFFDTKQQVQEAFLTWNNFGVSMLLTALRVEYNKGKAGAVEVVLEAAQDILTDTQLYDLVSSPAIMEEAKRKEKALLLRVQKSIKMRRSQEEECEPGEIGRSESGLHRTTDLSASLGDAKVTSRTDGRVTLKEEVTLAQALCAGPRVFRSEEYGVELELQEGSLEQDEHAAVTILPQLRFVVYQTEYQGRILSEEFFAMPFVSGPEGVKFREDKPALLRFFLGLAEDFLSEDDTDPQVVGPHILDEKIETTVREWCSPLSSPDGTQGWVSLGSYAVKYRHEENDREVWVETPLRHFSKVANGVRTNIPGYRHEEHSTAPYYYEDISFLPRSMRGRAGNLKVRFGNVTEITDRSKEAQLTLKAGTAVAGGKVGKRGRSQVRGSHLPAFQDPFTTVVPSGTFRDTELPYDIKAHKQMRVRIGVLKELSSSEPDAMGKLQLLDEMPESGNKIMVLRQPRLQAPS